ncbi:hypothetical protein F2Q69_00037713 [Brassica cretica]|uniref:Uncharacterized protein n=1 Tax=Brassica cretica TaxID=69181 RepID=A0A8S9SU54_BRACR|nr:hypothetical protein F2Q69_00037713 [Brassica cretica]
MESPVSRSDSSSEAGEGTDYDLMAPFPLSCVYAAPPLVGPASSVDEDELAVWRSSRNSSCSFGRRESCSPGAAASCGLTSGDMSGGATTDPFAAYQEVAKVMSSKKRSSSRSASGDEVMITGRRRSPVVKLEPSPSLSGKRPKSGGVTTRSAQQSADIARSAGSLATALSNLNLNVFPLDGTVLPVGDSSEVIQVLQGGLLRTVSQLHHLGGRLSDEGLLILREEVEVLKRQESREREQRVAREFEIRDLKEKIKDLEKVAESSSADVLAVNQKNQELEEDIKALKAAAETFKFEMVMAVNGARVVARWEFYEGMAEEAECQVGLGHGVGKSQGAKSLEVVLVIWDLVEIRGSWRSRGSLWTLRSRLGPGGPFSRSWDRDWGPEAMWESGDSLVRSGDSLIRSGDRGWNPEAFEAMSEPGGFDPEIIFWNPEEPRGSSLDHEIFDWNPEAIGEPGGTVLRLPRQGYYRYLFGFRILPPGSWPLSSSYVVFYFCRKSLTGLEGAGVGVMTQVPGYTGVLGSFDIILRLAHTHSCFMSHTRFDSLWACHCGRATLVRVGQDQRPLET